MTLRFLSVAAAAAGLLFLGAGCGLFGDETGGQVVIRLTDEPLIADSVIVSIVSVEFIDSESGERETVVLEPAAEGINLLEYQEGATLLIADGEVSLARFDQFRLRVGDSPTIWFGTDGHDLHIASGASSGIKFFLDEALELNGGTFDVTLDFDAAESVVPLGPADAPTGWVFTPVIRPVAATANGAELSVSEGVVEDGA